jgi:hypothetical protein
MATHFLKTHPPYFARVQAGEKNFEVRKNDRDFQTGDILVLQEWTPPAQCAPPGPGGTTWTVPQGAFTGAQITKRVAYVLPGGQFGVQAGFVVMALAEVLP